MIYFCRHLLNPVLMYTVAISNLSFSEITQDQINCYIFLLLEFTPYDYLFMLHHVFGIFIVGIFISIVDFAADFVSVNI
jgi:hypothetical protein